MTVSIYGPLNERPMAVFKQSKLSQEDAPLIVQATTFGEALLAYAERFQCHFAPATESEGRYFVLNAPGYIFDGGLYDPHIVRGELELCPKQDLQFALCDGDILDLAGPLAC